MSTMNKIHQLNPSNQWDNLTGEAVLDSFVMVRHGDLYGRISERLYNRAELEKLLSIIGNREQEQVINGNRV